MTEAAALATLAGHALFEGLDQASLHELLPALQLRHFAAGAALCHAGEVGDELFIVERGVAHVLLPSAASADSVVAKLRRGDVVGEMSFVTGEPRTATVRAVVEVDAFELRNEDLRAFVTRHPMVLTNLGGILTRRLADTSVLAAGSRQRGEAVALLVEDSDRGVASEAIAAGRAASPRPFAVLEAADELGETLAELDGSLAEHGIVVVVMDPGRRETEQLEQQVDRAVELASLSGHDPEWIGRHLVRAKLGLALGAGGAKGYAHIGAYRALESAGYTPDFVSGSSIGAVIAAFIALGLTADEVDAVTRATFNPEVVAAIFRPSMTGGSTGLATMTRAFRDATGDATFDDCAVPLLVMTVDLVSRLPVVLSEGAIWEALLAATALAGIFPPVERDRQRLVDGLALVPVPTGALTDAGADVTCAVNLISRDTLAAWPGQPEPEAAPRPKSSSLETLLEVIELSQLAASERHAGLANVTITPRFGPSTWRDFDLADLFVEAGYAATTRELPRLRSFAVPLQSSHRT